MILEKNVVDEKKRQTFSRPEKIRRVVIRWLKSGRQAKKCTLRKLHFPETEERDDGREKNDDNNNVNLENKH